MKKTIKLQLVCTDLRDMLKGDFHSCLSLYGYKPSIEGWLNLGEIEIELDYDHGKVTAQAVASMRNTVKRERLEHSVKISQMEDAINELLALPGPK